MMDHENHADAWGELRSMLTRPVKATREQWRELLAHLDGFEPGEREAAAHYAARALRDAPERWPASACSWRYSYRERDRPEPWQVPLIRGMEFDTISTRSMPDTIAQLDLEDLELEWISLEWFEMSTSALSKLMSAPSLSTLTALHLRNYDASAAQTHAIEALDGLALLERLEHLSLRHVTDEGSKATGEIVSQCSALKHLSLHGGLYEKRSWKHVFEAVSAPLTRLDLSGSNCGGAALDVLLHHQILDEVEHLDVSNTPDGSSMFKNLCKINNSRLRVLDVSSTGLGAAGLSHLERALFLGALREFSLTGNALRPLSKSLMMLREFGLCDQLERVELGSTGVGPKTAAVMLEAGLPRVRELDLGNNGLGDAGLEVVLQAPMPGLTHLDLHWNQLSDQALMRLTRADWKEIKSLRIDQYQRDVAPDVIEALGERFGRDVVKLI